MDVWFFSKCLALAYLFLFAIYLFFKNNKLNKGNYFLALFLLVESISILNTFLWIFFPYTHIHMPNLFYIDNSIFYLRGALLYLYIQSYTNEDFKVKISHLLHLLPFILLSVLYYFYFHRFTYTEKLKILEKGVFTPFIFFLIDILLHFYIIFYLILSVVAILKYKLRLKNVFADYHKIWLNWTYFLVGGFLLIMLLDITYMVVYFYLNIFPFFIVNIMNILVFLLTVLIMFNGLQKPEIFATITDNSTTKYASSKLKESERIKIKKKLDYLLQSDKIFKESSISIKDLADKIGVLPKHLSQVINEDYKHNFFDLINGFRVEEAKVMLTKYSNDEKNVLEILYETGFNSKTSFNLAFKKHTGQTPTAYRRLFYGLGNMQ